MITERLTVPTEACAKAYKFLSEEVGPPERVDHFKPREMFAEFGPITMVTRAPEDIDPEDAVLSVYLHDEAEEMGLYNRLLAKVRHFSGIETDVLDPFN
jgi:hypothetical protein